MSSPRTDHRADRRAPRRGDTSRFVPLAVGAVVLSAALGMGGAVLAGGADTAAHDLAVDRVVRPIPSQRCVECHSEAEAESGFSIANRAAIIAGGEKYGP